MKDQRESLEARMPWLHVGLFAAGLLLLFGADLAAWLRFGLNSSLYSYTLLIPLIVAGLQVGPGGWRNCWTPPDGAVSRAIGGAGLIMIALVFLGFGRWDIGALAYNRLLALVTVIATGFLFWRGWGRWRERLFLAMFLFLSIPLSPEWEQAFSGFLQYWSGWLSYYLIRWTGTPIVRADPYLFLPNLNLEVAEECSGIRSTLVLIVTSLLAAYLFLRGSLPRLALVAMVIPLGILRNAFRILVISMLTLYVDPNAIYGPIHRRGGPLFFALSLVLFFLWLWALRRCERLWISRKELEQK